MDLLSSFGLQTFLTIILGLVAVLLSLYQIHNKIPKFICTGIVVLLSIALFLVSNNVHKEQDKKFDDIFSEVRADLANKNLSTQEIEEKLKLAYQNYYDASPQEAKTWFNSFHPKISEKIAQRKEISSQEQDLAQKLEIKWKPLCDYILISFDDRIRELEKRNLIQKTESNDIKSFFQPVETEFREYEVRSVTFIHGIILTVSVKPATIRSGELHSDMAVMFKESDSRFHLFGLRFTEDTYKLSASNKPKEVAKQDPLLDQKFRNLLIEAINGAIEQVYLDDAQK